MYPCSHRNRNVDIEALSIHWKKTQPSSSRLMALLPWQVLQAKTFLHIFVFSIILSNWNMFSDKPCTASTMQINLEVFILSSFFRYFHIILPYLILIFHETTCLHIKLYPTWTNSLCTFKTYFIINQHKTPSLTVNFQFKLHNALNNANFAFMSIITFYVDNSWQLWYNVTDYSWRCLMFRE